MFLVFFSPYLLLVILTVADNFRHFLLRVRTKKQPAYDDNSKQSNGPQSAQHYDKYGKSAHIFITLKWGNYCHTQN